MSSFSPSLSPFPGDGDASPHLLRAVRRHLVVFVVVLVVLPVLATAALAQRTASYTSTSTVYLRPTTGNALSPDSAKNSQQVTVAMETEAGLVVGPAVAALVGKTIHRTVTAGSSDVSALVPPNTQMVQIGYTDSTPARARAGADAYAEAFLANREAVAKEVNDRQLDLLNEQATAVSRSLERVSKDAASDSPSPESAALVQLNGNRLSNLQDLIGQLQATDIDPGSVVTPATTPSRRTGLDSRLIVGAAALLGLLLATVVAVWRDRADDRLRVSEEDSIGEVPYFATLQAGRPSRAGHNAERHRLANAYRQVRALLLTSAGQPAVVVLAAADQHSDPAVPTITANLAVTLTDASYRVCLVDLSEAAHAEKVLAPGAEPPAPGSGPGLEDPVGLIESLPTLRGIALLAAGRLPVDDPGLLVSARFADLVTALRAAFDVVLVAAAPALTARGTESSLAADRMVLLVTDRVSTHEGVAEVIARQARMRVPVVGMVALRAAGRASGPADFDALPPLHTNRLVENPALGKETIAATAPKAPDSGDEHQAARQIDLTDAGPDTTQPMPPVLKATRFVPPGPVTPDRTTGKRS